MTRRIAITRAPIDTPREEALAIVSHDPDLCAAIDRIADDASRHDVEIFYAEGNCLVTERGYVYAFWVDDLQKVEGER